MSFAMIKQRAINVFSYFKELIYSVISQVMNPTFMSPQFVQRAIANPLQNEKCIDLHQKSCNIVSLEHFKMGCLGTYKMYILAHLIPLILFKRKKIASEPTKELKKLMVGFIKSLLFAGGYAMLIRRIICWLTEYKSYHSSNGFYSCLFAGITLIFEPLGRQIEISLYCMNKTIETAYNMGIRRKYPIRIPYGECLLNSVAIAILCYVYMVDSSTFRQNYRKALDQLLKDV